jgi:hypothetical protein
VKRILDDCDFFAGQRPPRRMQRAVRQKNAGDSAERDVEEKYQQQAASAA